MRVLSFRPICPYDDRWVRLEYLSAARRYTTRQNDLLGKMDPFEADRHRRSPPLQHGSEGETIPQIASNENWRQNLLVLACRIAAGDVSLHLIHIDYGLCNLGLGGGVWDCLTGFGLDKFLQLLL